MPRKAPVDTAILAAFAFIPMAIAVLLAAGCGGESEPKAPAGLSDPCSPLYATALEVSRVAAYAQCKDAECVRKADAVVDGLAASAKAYCHVGALPDGGVSMAGVPGCDGCRVATR